MTLYRKRLAAWAIAIILILTGIIIAASIPAKAEATESRLLDKAWDAGGAQADEYSIKAYWKYTGEKSDETISQIVKDMADALGVNSITQQYSTPEKNETELHGKNGKLDIAICTTYFTDKQNLVLLCAINSATGNDAINTAEDMLKKALQYKPGADVYRQMTGTANGMTRMEMTDTCNKIFNNIQAANIQGSFGENYISTFAYVDSEPVYLTNDGQRCNIQIAIRQATTGKTNVLIGIPAILEGY